MIQDRDITGNQTLALVLGWVLFIIGAAAWIVATLQTLKGF